MPILTVPFVAGVGVRVRAQVTLGRPELLRRRQALQPIPPPFPVVALLDTGAERTCVDPAVVARPGLPHLGAVLTYAPGLGAGPAALGGATANFSYEAGLVLLHPVVKPPSNLVIPELVVDELPLAALGIEAVIGRDVLAGCVLVYDGPAGSATLAY
jgi:hypothetical protein